MSTNHLHAPLQLAYRSQHSIEPAILKIHNDIIEGLDDVKCTVLGSLDLSAAFDTVDHVIRSYSQTLKIYGVNGSVLKWFGSLKYVSTMLIQLPMMSTVASLKAQH